MPEFFGSHTEARRSRRGGEGGVEAHNTPGSSPSRHRLRLAGAGLQGDANKLPSIKWRACI